MTSPAPPPVLEVRDLKKHFPVRGGIFRRVVGKVHAVDGVSFQLHAGETLGLVGESGCGKTTLGRTIIRLYDVTSGTIRFEGDDISQAKGRALLPVRRRMAMIFQDPYSSLNPRMTVADIIAAPLRTHGVGTARQRRQRVLELLDVVGLRPETANRYPHEFSGGQRQRIGIARALALEPSLVVCDEPVSALDVSIQAQVVNLLLRLKRTFGLTYIFIAHDLSVVKFISTSVAVMYLGRIVEKSASKRLYATPRHPYTQALLRAVPIPDPRKRAPREGIGGEIPSPMAPPAGCAFHTRCPLVEARCRLETPTLRNIGPAGEEHLVACHLV
ncbi:MAG: ATP-binding cassette domain-containing protein [Deltaproteobacteria bacterium]|nr:MAG: ATP-binding cassette domain-containing protein [Deltaproteobacteria bacterium]